jgi:hypothetical protein
MQSDDISDLVQSELTRLADPHRRASLESYLVRPQKLSLAWDYGSEGERFDCWRVGQSPSGDILLMFCKDGFGPEFPWGFVFPESKSLGMDSQWHSGLEDAAICAGLLEAPDGYQSPGPRE